MKENSSLKFLLLHIQITLMLITCPLVFAQGDNSHLEDEILPACFTVSKSLPEQASDLLEKNLYQEAIWLFYSLKEYEQASRLLFCLDKTLRYDQLIQGKNENRSLERGASAPKIVEFSSGIFAVFKKKAYHPSASFHAEVAAYHLNRLLGLRIIPMTVTRKINGKIGSLQYFMRTASEVKEIPSDEDFLEKLFILDYLIENKDRNIFNLLQFSDGFIAIDHGLSLRKWNYLGRFLNQKDRIFKSMGLSYDPMRNFIYEKKHNPQYKLKNKELIKRLKNISYEELYCHLSSDLSNSQIRRIEKRIKKLLATRT